MNRFIIAAAASLFIAHAAAEQLHGVEVYPGAKAHAETNQFLKESLKVDGQAYVTGDSLEKVTQFYKKQSGIRSMSEDKESSAFMGKGVMVTIQNPWMDMKSGKKTASTLVSIVKQ